MPLLVNGEIITRELIREEERCLAQDPGWQGIPEGLEKGMRLRETAEWSVIDRILLRLESDKDTRPIDPAVVAEHVQRVSTAQGCRTLFDDGPLSRQIEAQLRLDRTLRGLMGVIPEPTEEEVIHIYKTQRQNFVKPDMVQAAHIVKQVDEIHQEAEAYSGILTALAELDQGEPFAAVAERHSDCKGNGGDLGAFPRGVMVDEFDEVVFAMQPGTRSPIFRTPFGFHIAEVRARIPGGIAKLNEVKDDIRSFLISTRAQEAARRATEHLRAQAQIRRISANEAATLSGARRSG